MLGMWIQFFICAVVIVFAGVKLTVYADLLSDRLNLGKVWIGAVVLGLVTSLPEAVATLTAVVHLDAVDLAVGNLVGSNNFNPLLIVVMDMFYRKGSITNAIEPNRYHNLSCSFSILMSIVVIVGLCWGSYLQQFAVGHISLSGIIIALIYIAGMKIISGEQAGVPAEVEGELVGVKADAPLNRIYLGLLITTVFVVGAAIYLANIADRIAEATGLGGTFVGSIFLAIITSLPEMVVSIQSVKMGVFDLAIGNIFGSNMTNTFIIFLCDLFSVKGPILLLASSTHILTVVVSIILSLILVVGIRMKNKRVLWNIGWDSIVMTMVFLVGVRILYNLR